MREIKFRGKRIDTGEWVFGYFSMNDENGKCYITNQTKAGGAHPWQVIPETVGQYTGTQDKNGKEIYEGDIYKKHNNTYLVMWTSHGFMWQTIYDNWLNKNIFSRAEKSWLSEIDCKNFIEVIGNIHDNPELIHDQKAEV